MNTPTIPHTFGDALHRVRMEIMHYQERFPEDSDQYRANERLLHLIDAAPDMERELTQVRDTIIDEQPRHAHKFYRIPQINAALKKANPEPQPIQWPSTH